MIIHNSWSVHIEYAAPEGAERLTHDDERWDAFADAGADYAANVGWDASVPFEPDRYSVSLYVDAEDPFEAAGRARDIASKMVWDAGLPEWPAVRLEAKTEAELDAELAEPNFPLLLGAAEVAKYLGVTRQRIAELRKRPDFPKPIVELAAGPIWLQGAVSTFVETWDRRPGRKPAGMPFGFRVAEDGQVATDDHEQAAVQFVGSLHLAGASAEEIAERLEAAGFKPPEGDRWDTTTVRRIAAMTPKPARRP